MSDNLLPAEISEGTYAAQLARVRLLGKRALKTPGARLSGIIMLIFAPAMARWFLEGVSAAGRTKEPDASPFTYTMR
jgi:hypothetical protein